MSRYYPYSGGVTVRLDDAHVVIVAERWAPLSAVGADRWRRVHFVAVTSGRYWFAAGTHEPTLSAVQIARRCPIIYCRDARAMFPELRRRSYIPGRFSHLTARGNLYCWG